MTIRDRASDGPPASRPRHLNAQLVVTHLVLIAAVLAATVTLSQNLSIWLAGLTSDLGLSVGGARQISYVEVALLPVLAAVVLLGGRANPWLLVSGSATVLLGAQALSFAVGSTGLLVVVRLLEVVAAASLLGGSIHLAGSMTAGRPQPPGTRTSGLSAPLSGCWASCYSVALFALPPSVTAGSWQESLHALWWLTLIATALGFLGLWISPATPPAAYSELPAMPPLLAAIIAPAGLAILLGELTESSQAAAIWPLVCGLLIVALLAWPLRSTEHGNGLTLVFGGILAGWAVSGVLVLVQPLGLGSLLDGGQLLLLALASMAGAATATVLRSSAMPTLVVAAAALAGVTMLLGGSFIQSSAPAGAALLVTGMVIAGSATAVHAGLFRQSHDTSASGVVVLASRLGGVVGGYLAYTQLLGELRSSGNFGDGIPLALLETLIVSGLIVLAGAILLGLVLVFRPRPVTDGDVMDSGDDVRRRGRRTPH